jgi:alpha-1,3-mannosyltransferase
MASTALAAADRIRRIGPVTVRVRTLEGALQDVRAALIAKTPLHIAFANTHLVYEALKDQRLARLLDRFYILNDGIGLTALSKLISGRAFPDNLNGTDFTPLVLAAAPDGARVFLVGAAPGIAERLSARMARDYPHLQVCGVFDGFSARGAAKSQVFAALRETSPDLVLAAMGNPLQELWIEEAAREAPQAVMIGVGALFDFMTGAVERAPPAWRRLNLEWAYRLMREPRRLLFRYTVEIATLAVHGLRWRLQRAEPSR